MTQAQNRHLTAVEVVGVVAMQDEFRGRACGSRTVEDIAAATVKLDHTRDVVGTCQVQRSGSGQGEAVRRDHATDECCVFIRMNNPLHGRGAVTKVEAGVDLHAGIVTVVDDQTSAVDVDLRGAAQDGVIAGRLMIDAQGIGIVSAAQGRVSRCVLGNVRGS